MTDSWIKDRVKRQYLETPPDKDASPGRGGARTAQPTVVSRFEQSDRADALPEGDVQAALDVLARGQRAAEGHVANAQRQADRVRSAARTRAEQVMQESQAQVDGIRRKADAVLSDARAGAARVAEDARADAGSARQKAERIVSEAAARAAGMARDAQARADELAHQADLRYEEMVGTLVTEREVLQRRIEALQQLDRDYSGRLLTCVQVQLRDLWVDKQMIDGEVGGPDGGSKQLRPIGQLPPARQPAKEG